MSSESNSTDCCLAGTNLLSALSFSFDVDHKYGVAGGSFTRVGRAQGQMPYRTLGSTGERVSLLTLGGAHIGYRHVSEEESIRIMHAAIDGGINFFDNSWDYNRGGSEERMGRALSMDGYREKVFLMTKFCCHSQFQ